MKSLFVFIRTALLLGVLAVACGPATPVATTGPLQPVRINMSARSGAHAALWYAYEKGLFQKYGLEPQLLEIEGGSTEALAAMLRGELDFSTGSANGILSAVLAGEERVLVGTFYNKPVFQFVVGPDIQKPEDLIGKSIAVGNLGAFKDKMALLALDHLGLDPAQVNFVPLRENDEPLMVASIEGGTTSAAVLAAPLLRPYREAGLHVMVDLSELDSSYIRLGFGTLRSFIAEHRDIAIGTLKALLEAAALMPADPEGTKAILAQYTGLDPVADAEDLDAMYDAHVTRNLQTDLYPSEAALQFSVDLEVPNNPEAANLVSTDYVDFSLLDEIRASGFMDTLP
jgi:NitT/TauT family transport system substrate-binding protein